MKTHDDAKKGGVCMACECPCAMHTEHNHAVAENSPKAGVCKACGHAHKADGSCDCGCA